MISRFHSEWRLFAAAHLDESERLYILPKLFVDGVLHSRFYGRICACWRSLLPTLRRHNTHIGIWIIICGSAQCGTHVHIFPLEFMRFLYDTLLAAQKPVDQSLRIADAFRDCFIAPSASRASSDSMWFFFQCERTLFHPHTAKWTTNDCGYDWVSILVLIFVFNATMLWQQHNIQNTALVWWLL